MTDRNPIGGVHKLPDRAPGMIFRPLHDTDGLDCWCRPRVLQLCEECVERESEDCWKCGGEGTIPCPDPARYDGVHGLIVVHNDTAPVLGEN